MVVLTKSAAVPESSIIGVEARTVKLLQVSTPVERVFVPALPKEIVL
jgi:hypothetical protein